jgi:hypothetical protein
MKNAAYDHRLDEHDYSNPWGRTACSLRDLSTQLALDGSMGADTIGLWLYVAHVKAPYLYSFASALLPLVAASRNRPK